MSLLYLHFAGVINSRKTFGSYTYRWSVLLSFARHFKLVQNIQI